MTQRSELPDLDQLTPEALKALIVSRTRPVNPDRDPISLMSDRMAKTLRAMSE